MFDLGVVIHVLCHYRSFVRKYILPDDANVDSLRSSLNHKGHLTIEAPKKTQSLTQPRAIPITRG